MAIQYINSDFETFKNDLINFAKTRFPNDFIYLNDASPDMMYLEMLSYLGVVLGDNTDKAFNESFISEAKARGSLVRAANDFYFNNFTKTSSFTQLKVAITVPFIIEDGVVKPDPSLLLNIKKGMQVQSRSGVKFETIEDVNFADSLNRKIVPNYNNNNEIESFKIIKSCVIKSGVTKIQRLYIDENNIEPFLRVTIADTDVTEVVGVIGIQGDVFQLTNDSLFDDLDYKYNQVDFLTEDKMFVELNDNVNTLKQIKQGEWVAIPRRFIIKTDVNNLITLIFGSSSTNFDIFEDVIQSYIDNNISLNTVLNNNTLGEIPSINSTLFIKYRVGGGLESNIQSYQIDSVVTKELYPLQMAVDFNKFNIVKNNIEVYNEMPALGGRDVLSNEELKYTLPKVFATQRRVVTYEDIKAYIAMMPPKFGSPYRVSAEEIKPGVISLAEVTNYISSQLSLIENNTIFVERQKLIQDTNNYLNSIPGVLATLPINSTTIQTQANVNSLILDNNDLSLWLGEKVRLYVLGIDEAGKLVTVYKDSNGIWQYPNEILKTNIKNWLIDKRVIGDWIDIVDGRVVNLQMDFTVIVDNSNKQEVLSKCLQRVKDYFNIDNWQLGQSIYIANVQAILQEIKGVVNVVDIKFYNIWGVDRQSGRKYSDIEPGRYKNLIINNNYNNNRYEIQLVNNTIVGQADTLFEIRYSDTDIIGRVL